MQARMTAGAGRGRLRQLSGKPDGTGLIMIGDLGGTHSHHHMWKLDRRGWIPGPLEQTLAVLLSSALACCRWELERRHMTPPSRFALRIIVEEDCKLVRTLNAPDGGLETSERDALFDVLGSHFTGRLWPRSFGTEATRRYLADLQHAMIAAGWKVNSFAVTT